MQISTVALICVGEALNKHQFRTENHVLAHGSAEATEHLKQHCLKHVCPHVYGPKVEETIDVTSDLCAYKPVFTGNPIRTLRRILPVEQQLLLKEMSRMGCSKYDAKCIQDIYITAPARNYFDVLAGCGPHPPSVTKNTSELTQEVLESLFNAPKSLKHESESMNWRNAASAYADGKREYAVYLSEQEQRH
ncbi:hypothetical protein L1987_37009 [Smallanthus sonchifolius]|uniref:Uncharacterized protein n=1 Tax=Smallanthus sonchifolius TaxID=185202 RepID=A0ACB9HEQ3_9ASTR|nr:hypothetical protein L1987_37009 [Smallanthus sonchifolius]